MVLQTVEQPWPWDDCFGFNNGMSARLLWSGKLQLKMSSVAPSIVTVDKPLLIKTRWEMVVV
ncbi:hypothetical protein LPW36_04105 [Jinshanibacter sp. LJY008]|uniref:Uncharacterized protein n=1 Tax=Limnobaculum eriocheiris TaxID=2897391 RepID=A0A9X1MTF4_9GAMM|nr:hypothetical protein [Limnobaculum eriocheiris]MCD1125216.1 hypothetical protein [Limnobaculum eriocheiris]